jgi:type I restriction enzyme S subunit
MTNTTTHTKPLIPKLRFKEFEGEWEEKKIGEVLTIGSGKDYKHLKEGKIPVYGTGGLMTYVDKYLYDGESVCIGRKGTIDKPVYLNKKFWTVDTLFYTHSFKKSLPKFIFGIFERINWKLYNEASGVPSLSKGTIEKIKVSFPNLPEQQKIANFLTAVDTKLQQLTTKKETLAQYKKGVMQQLFSQQLRFKPDNTNETVIARTQDEAISPNETQFPDWKRVKLGDVCEFTQGVQIPNSEQVNIEKEGYVRYLYIRDFFTNSFPCYVKNEFPHKIINEDEIMMVNTGNTAGKAYKGAYGILSNNCFKITFDKKLIDSNYLFFVLTGDFSQNQIKRFFNAGGQPHLGHKNIAMIPFNYPSLKEQQKIANYLSAIDKKIEAVQMQLTQTQAFKKGLLQAMFV